MVLAHRLERFVVSTHNRDRLGRALGMETAWRLKQADSSDVSEADLDGVLPMRYAHLELLAVGVLDHHARDERAVADAAQPGHEATRPSRRLSM